MQPIKMDNDLMNLLCAQFKEMLKNGLKNPTISYTKNLCEVKKDFIEIKFVNRSYEKMMALVRHFDTEIAWHGLVNRVDDTHFEITDILVYPQIVSGATVETDQSKYQMWLMDPDVHSDEEFSHIRMQGHSHVNMSTSPSCVDLNNQDRMLQIFGEEDFFIFLIWNKREEHTCRLYDMKNNVMYNESDIHFLYESEFTDFLQGSEAMLEKRAPAQVATAAVGAAGAAGGYAYAAASAKYGVAAGGYNPSGSITYNNGKFYNDDGTEHKFPDAPEKKEKAKTETETKEQADLPMSKTYNNSLKEYYSDYPDDLGAFGNSSSYLYADYNYAGD